MSSNTAVSKMQKILNKNQIFNRSSDISELNGENFDRIMSESLDKAINSIDREPVKEKHIRKLVIGTFKSKSGRFFWRMLSRQRIREDLAICLKFCYVLHKLLRDGHRQVALDSREHLSHLSSVADYWHYFDEEKRGVINYYYSHMLINRIKFLCQNASFPNDLKMNDKLIDEADPVLLFDICCEILDQTEEVLNLVIRIYANFEHLRLNSTSQVGKFTLAPIVPCVQDAYSLYDYLIKILFKLFATLDSTMLAGHLKRFNGIHLQVYDTQRKIRDLHYLKSFIQWPDFPQTPPNFSNNLDLSRHNKAPKLTVIPQLQDDSTSMLTESSVSDFPDMLVDISEQIAGPSIADLSLGGDSPARSSPSPSADASQLSSLTTRDLNSNQILIAEAASLKLAEDRGRELELVISELKSEKAAIRAEFENEIAVLKLESTKSLDLLAKNHEIELKKLKSELSTVRCEHQQTRKQLQEAQSLAETASHKLEINEEVMKKLAKDTNELKKLNLANSVQAAPVIQPTVDSSQLSATKAELADSKRKLAELERELGNLKLECDRLKADKLNLDEQLSKRQENQVQAEMVEMERMISEATRKLEELGERARLLKAAGGGNSNDKLKLEVNERISVVCTSLMEAVRKLMVQSRRLQHEIVRLGSGNGNGSSTTHENQPQLAGFYQKNSNWTEGLISAANVVAMAARSLVDTADRSMSGQARFSELSAAANEIQAATTRLLVASRVRAPKESDQLVQLVSASKLVTECKSKLVEACHECDELIEGSESGQLELSTLSAHQTRKLEIETKAKIIELQTSLQREQEKLGRLNRQHYQQEAELERT